MKKRNVLTVKKMQRNDAGLTLIELTFAAGVLAVALSVMMGALLSLTVMGDVAEGRTRAVTALAGVIEEIHRVGPEMLAQTPEPVESNGYVMAVMIEAIDTDGIAMELPLAVDANGNPSATLPNPVEIQVTVMWEGVRGRVFSARSTTMMGN